MLVQNGGVSGGGVNLNEPPAVAYREYLDSELASESERSLHSTVTQIGRYGILKFGAAALSCPFETVRILRQIQLGSGEDRGESNPEEMVGPEDWRSVGSTTSLEQLQRDRQEHLTRSNGQKIAELYANIQSPGGEVVVPRLPADVCRDSSTGYLTEKPRPLYVSSQWPVLLDKEKNLGHSLGIISQRQGLFSLWKGVVAAWAHDVLMDLGRATIEEALDGGTILEDYLRFPSVIEPIVADEVLRPALVAGVAQGLIGTLLSPLEMIRLRLVAQSIWVSEQKYFGLRHALTTIIREETGLIGLFKHPILTFVSFFLKPVLRIAPVSLLNIYGGPRDDTSIPIALGWLFLQNATMCLPLLLTMPLETIRRRLLVQCTTTPPTHSGLVPYITRVPISPILYKGTFNCLWRILREEGPAALYQGWGLQVASSSASFVATLLAQLGEEDLGDDDLESF